MGLLGKVGKVVTSPVLGAAIGFVSLGMAVASLIKPSKEEGEIDSNERTIQSKYHFCPYCQAEVNKDFIFCPSCGKKIR